MLRYMLLENNTVFWKVYLSKLSFGVIIASLVASVYANIIGSSATLFIVLLIGYVFVVFIAYLVVNSKRKKIRNKTFTVINEVIPIHEHNLAIRWNNTKILDIIAHPVQPVNKEEFPVLETALSENVQKPRKESKWWVSDNVLSANEALYARFSPSQHDVVNRTINPPFGKAARE